VWVTQDAIDGTAFKTTGHSLGDRTQILFRVADKYLAADAPDAAMRAGKSDFDLQDDAVRYETPGGVYAISYAAGYPVGKFELTTGGTTK
jgi:hypothetical protein